MTGFELQISRVGSDPSTNAVPTNAHYHDLFVSKLF